MLRIPVTILRKGNEKRRSGSDRAGDRTQQNCKIGDRCGIKICLRTHGHSINCNTFYISETRSRQSGHVLFAFPSDLSRLHACGDRRRCNLHPADGAQPRGIWGVGGRRSLSGPRIRPARERSPGSPKPQRQNTRPNHGAAAAARGTSSRSSRSNWRRASRARWSSSTRGTLLLQTFNMAPSIARPPRPLAAGAAARSISAFLSGEV